MSETSAPSSPPSPVGWRRWVVDSDPAGPTVVRAYHTGLAAISVVAWGSLLSQVKLLIGWQGLTPVQSTLIQMRASDVFLSWVDFPSHLFFDDSDASIVGGCIVGLVVSLLALVGVWPRLMFALSALLYLGYCIAAQTFLSFQWDNLLIEASVLAVLLSRSRPSPVAHWMGRALLFKIFFQSGLAKWGSPLGDWQSGVAMAHYYETAPLPTPLAWFFHHLPAAWHTLESWWALFFELVLAWGVFFGRTARWLALAAFASFLLVDFATANYGFFVPLAAVLCVLLLPESTVARLHARGHAWLRQRLPRLPARTPVAPARSPFGELPMAALAVAWVGASAYTASMQFTDLKPDFDRWQSVRKWRVSNAYHLFTSITTRRHEPELQTSPDGQQWTAHSMVYKAGPVDRAPPWVAPHQPRVDFRLWFHGLGWERSTPPYVANLLKRVCWDPEVVSPLFTAPLPADTKHVRLVYWDHAYTSWAEGWSSGHWWTREKAGATRDISCDKLGW